MKEARPGRLWTQMEFGSIETRKLLGGSKRGKSLGHGVRVWL